MVIGFLGIGFSLYSLIFIVDYSNLTEEYHTLVGALGFGLIGAILTSEKVKIPPLTSQVLIKQKSKEGRGYIQGAVGFGYKIKSCDVYFDSNRRMIRIINTDYKRAIKIAELLKETLSIDYLIK